jgi:hypothetical protein
MAKTAGSIWVEGDNLCYIDQTGVEWQIVGSLVSNGPYVPGSLWVELESGLHYVGASGKEFLTPLYQGHVDAAAVSGSIWVQDTSFYFAANTAAYRVHADTAHQDGGGAATHVDVPGSNVGHGDSHTDSTHGDTHNDAPHGDFHGDGHTDIAHSDGHSDAHDDGHTDYHGDHLDLMTHWDCNLYNGAEPPGAPPQSHQDHQDSGYAGQGNLHCDVSHQDNHSDTAHQDSHGDSAHNDDHNDQAHQDSSHIDTHTDGSHGDTHSDIAHGDSPHQDHTDATHADVAHVDNPVYIGP